MNLLNEFVREEYAWFICEKTIIFIAGFSVDLDSINDIQETMIKFLGSLKLTYDHVDVDDYIYMGESCPIPIKIFRFINLKNPPIQCLKIGNKDIYLAYAMFVYTQMRKKYMEYQIKKMMKNPKTKAVVNGDEYVDDYVCSIIKEKISFEPKYLK